MAYFNITELDISAPKQPFVGKQALNSKTKALVTIYVSCIHLAIMIILSISFIHNMYCKRQIKCNCRSNMLQHIVLAELIGAVSMSMFAFLYSYSYYVGRVFYVKPFYVAFLLMTLSLGALLYWFMIQRVKDTFKDTIYEMSKIKFIMHTVNFVIIAILWIFWPAVVSKHVSIVIQDIYIVYIYIAYACGCTHLIYIFNQNLFSLVMLQKQTGNSLNVQQLKLLTTIRKHTILGVMLVLMELVYLAITLINNTLTRSSLEVYIATTVIASICTFVSSLCLYLGFNVHQKWYNWFCKYCDTACSILCINAAKSRMVSENDGYSNVKTECGNGKIKNIPMKETNSTKCERKEISSESSEHEP
eukprot:126428_1